MRLITKTRCLMMMIIAFFTLSTTAQALNVDVALGEDIQAAIDKVSAASGGTVNLSEGIYAISSTLKIKSNVNLCGVDSAKTIIQAISTFNVIENASEGLSNVSLQNLTIIGKHSASCYGILIQAGTTFHNNVRLSKVQVKEAGMGVHFKRVINLSVSDCNFHDNGSLDQLYFYHNLYIRSCTTVVVHKTYLNNSISANGLNISYCGDVSVTDCVANNNYFRGIRAANSDGFTVQNCVMDSNGDVGLTANSETTVTKNINFKNCTLTHNRNGGIQAKSGATGSISDCISTGNSAFNFQVPSTVTQNRNNIALYKDTSSLMNVLFSGEYYIKKKGSNLYWTNTNIGATTGGNPSWIQKGTLSNADAQIWIITASSEGYKISNKADGRYLNETAAFGKNTYASDWNTYMIYSVGTSAAIQITQKAVGAKTDAYFWNFDANNAIIYSADAYVYSTNFVFDIEPVNLPIKIYPNPVQDKLSLTFSTTVTNIDLINNSGQTLLSKKVDTNTLILDLSEYKSVTYILKVHSKDKVVVKKFIKL